MSAHEVYDTALCPSCTARIIWAVSTGGKPMPIDAAPVAGGNVQLRTVPGQAPLAVVLSPAKQFGLAGRLRLSHHATCPRPVRRGRR